MTTQPRPTYAEAIATAGEAIADSLIRQAERSPREAALAAGCRTEPEITAWIAEFRPSEIDSDRVSGMVGDPRLPAHFWAKVRPLPNGCWEWTAAVNSGGYGQWGVEGRSRSVHRIAHETFIGPILDGLTVDHECHNRDIGCAGGRCRHRRCCNPAHLKAKTQAENSAAGRRGTAKTHCPAGHPYAGSNLYVNPRGERHCRICQRAKRTRPPRTRPPRTRALTAASP